MKRDELLRLERLYNLVQPGKLRADVRMDQGWEPIAIFEDVSPDVDVQIGRWFCNNLKLNPLHPQNDREYHFAELVVAAINALPGLLMHNGDKS